MVSSIAMYHKQFNKISFIILNISKVKLATVVWSDQKAPFSIVTTPKCREGRYPFLWIAPLYPWYVPFILYCRVLSKEVSRTIFKVFGTTRPRIEPRSPGLLVNALLTWPKSQTGSSKHNKCKNSSFVSSLNIKTFRLKTIQF